MIFKKKKPMEPWRHIGKIHRGKRIHLVNGYLDEEGQAGGFTMPVIKKGEFVWAVNGVWYDLPSVTLGFEMHDLGGPSYEARGDEDDWFVDETLRNTKIPVFMPRIVPGFVNVHEYPLQAVMDYHNLKRPYFGESLNYCIAFAAMFKVREIVFVGFDYKNKDKPGERASTEFWCGIAKANGVKLTPDGNLMKADEWEPFYESNKYGYKV